MPISGQRIIALAGVAEPLGVGAVRGSLTVKALPGNAGNIYIGNDGDDNVDSTSGMSLVANQWVAFVSVRRLEMIYVNADFAGDGISWLMMDV